MSSQFAMTYLYLPGLKLQIVTSRFFRHLISQIAMSIFLAHHSSTPYNLAKSRSRITCLPRMTWMRFSIFSKGCNGADSTFSMSFFFAITCDYITIFTIRPGTTMTFLGVLPARYLDVSSCARTSFSTSSFGVSFGHSSVKRTLPLNCTGYFCVSSTRYASLHSGHSALTTNWLTADG